MIDVCRPQRKPGLYFMAMIYGSAALFAPVIMSGVAAAATYYVATTGSDGNPGTQARPFRTITYAYSRVVGGDTILVYPGRYTDFTGPGWGIHLGKRATSASRIRLQSIVTGKAIIDGQWNATRKVGVYMDGSYNIVRGFRITNNYMEGIVVLSGKNNIIAYCEIDNNGSNGEASRHSGVYTDQGSSGNVYLGNISHHNGNPSTAVKGHGFYAGGVANESYFNNIAYSNDGMGFQFASYSTIGSLRVMNNVAASNGKSGVAFWSPSATFTGAKIENNIFYGNGEAGIHLYQARGGGVTISNNIFFSNRLGDIRNDGSSLGYSATNLIRSNPLFVSATDFRVQAGSAAINRGLNLTSENLTIDRLGVRRPQGGAFDLGAYERVP